MANSTFPNYKGPQAIDYLWSSKAFKMKMTPSESEKKLAADYSVTLIKSGMTVGLGSGSTATYMIQKLGEEISNGLSITGVPSSEKSAKMARGLGIPLTTLDQVGQLDINIDGADEFDAQFRLIKGGGGALLREKILAYNSKCNVIIADSQKQVDTLGKFKLPLEVIPFASSNIRVQLDNMGLRPVLRKRDDAIYTTDENNYILDVNIFNVEDVHALNNFLIGIPGVVETGLFLESTDIIILGKEDKLEVLRNSHVTERKAL